mgnify:CR=1 FL=1
MIRILIITNNVLNWIDKIAGNSREYIFRKSNEILFINTPLFYVAITSEINDRSRGQRWNTIILDKDVSDKIYQQILLPSLWSIIDLRNK